jgi:hypothetical protein
LTDSYRSKLERIGLRRSDAFEKMYKGLGYFILKHPYNNTGIDMVVISTETGKIIEVLELTNYAYKWEYINGKKFDRYVITLNEFNFAGIKKILAVSFRQNLTMKQMETCKENSIEVKVMGYQD